MNETRPDVVLHASRRDSRRSLGSAPRELGRGGARLAVGALVLLAATIAPAIAPPSARADEPTWSLSIEGVVGPGAGIEDAPLAPALALERRFGRGGLGLVGAYGLERERGVANATEHRTTLRARGFLLLTDPTTEASVRAAVLVEVGYGGAFRRRDAAGVEARRERERALVASVSLRADWALARWLAIRASVGLAYALEDGNTSPRRHRVRLVDPISTLGLAFRW